MGDTARKTSPPAVRHFRDFIVPSETGCPDPLRIEVV